MFPRKALRNRTGIIQFVNGGRNDRLSNFELEGEEFTSVGGESSFRGGISGRLSWCDDGCGDGSRCGCEGCCEGKYFDVAGSEPWFARNCLCGHRSRWCRRRNILGPNILPRLLNKRPTGTQRSRTCWGTFHPRCIDRGLNLESLLRGLRRRIILLGSRVGGLGTVARSLGSGRSGRFLLCGRLQRSEEWIHKSSDNGRNSSLRLGCADQICRFGG